jgi:hypothetical protein
LLKGPSDIFKHRVHFEHHLASKDKGEPSNDEDAHVHGSRAPKQDAQVFNDDHHPFSFSLLTFCNTQVGFIHDLFRKHEISTPFHLEEINTMKMKSKVGKDVTKRPASETPSKHEIAPPFQVHAEMDHHYVCIPAWVDQQIPFHGRECP